MNVNLDFYCDKNQATVMLTSFFFKDVYCFGFAPVLIQKWVGYSRLSLNSCYLFNRLIWLINLDLPPWHM